MERSGNPDISVHIKYVFKTNVRRIYVSTDFRMDPTMFNNVIKDATFRPRIYPWFQLK